MKNLKLVSELSLQLDLQFEGETILLSAFDIERSRVFFASSANLIYTLHLPSSSEKRTPWSNALLASEAEEVTLEPGENIVAMDYLMEKEALIIGSSSGCLILYNVDDKATEVVGRVEGGVTGIASSPDGALLSVTAGLGQLLVMTHDWEVLYEAGLDAQISNGVLADDPDGPSSSQTQSPISWRGDGRYFATLGGVDNSACLKKLMIWERESGMLLSTSEPKAFMGASLDWMPSGAKVAAAYDQKAESKCPLVVFFEKNGLERSSFPIGEPVEAAIEILKWNCNSELLAASVTCSQYDAIKIWCCSNSHWYLKQEIRYSKKEGVKFTWDPTKPLHLVCWTLGGHIMNYKFAWTSAVTETSTALVIDDSNILVTPLALSLIPPPMALFNLKFQSSVRDISFVSKSSKSHLAAFLSDGSLCVVELPETDTWDQFEGSQFSIEVCHSDSRMESFTHLTWLDSHLLLSVSCCCADYCSTSSMIDTVVDHQQKKRTSCFSLHEIELVCSEDSLPGSVSSSGWQAKVTKTVSLDGPVICIVPNPAKRCSAFIQFSGGNVVEYSSNTGSLRIPTGLQFSELDSEYKFPSSCPSMKAVLCHAKGVARPLLFGLDDNGRLHVGKRTLTSSCSSFAFYCNTIGSAEQVVTHLLFTSKQDLLFIININDILCGNMEVKIDSYSSNHNKEEGKDHVTIWEKGAKLIGVLHGDEAAALLQTCRGNLECIYPRKLVLVSIINALVQRRFRDAMVMVRRQRIDFNVLVDYCGWRAFVKSAAEFVSQVNNLGHITEFICAVKKENVINTLYKTYISLPNETSTEYADNSPSDCKESKVSSVLTAVRKALEEQVQETPARELCILTTLARTEPPALEEALNRIKVIRELELLGADDARRKLYPSAEESLKHLLWLTDPEAVYDAALGLYDLNLAAIVALNSQKDPKEFLPFLKGLECLSPVIMRYKIDLRLNRYDSALKHIVSAGDDYHEDCMNLLNSNPELFPLGLQLFTDPAKKRQILEAWGDHLYAAKCFEDAATTYLCCSSYQKSLKAYRSCGDWKCVLTVAAILKLGKEEILQLANELCEEFQELGKPAEAATIALEYCKDFVRGVRYYIMARKWEEALRIAYMHGREDLVTDVRDAALECASTLISEYQEGSEKLGKYLARYLAVRQRRLVLAAKIQLEDKSMSDAEYDTVSETSSFSGMSAYTTRTLRTSRSSLTSSKASKAHAARGQKKGGKIRAGSPGEEMALVEHMKGMSLTAGAQCELKSLIIALLSLGKEDAARQLQYAGDKFELSHKAAIKLSEDTMASEKIDENSQTLEHYLQKLRSLPHPENHSWQIKVLLPPSQVHSSN